MSHSAGTGHLPRSHPRCSPGSLDEPTSRLGSRNDSAPHLQDAELTVVDEPAVLRGLDGLTDGEREALTHRYDIVFRGTL